MNEFEKVFDKLFELHMHGDLDEFKSKYKTLFNKVILKSVEIHTNSLMKESLEVIDGYLNAGCKDQRKKVHQAGRAYYRKVTGTDYLNKNERK